MDYPYFLSIDRRHDSDQAHALDLKLHAMGMRCRLQNDLGRLFMHPDAPTVEICGHGLLLGKVFDREGVRISARIDLDPSAERVIPALLQRVWGHYVALLFSDRTVRVIRDPSGGIDCIYALDAREGFIVSDIVLAIELGLYRRCVDWEAIAHGLQFPFMKIQRTALKQINELLPGCELRIEGPRCAVHTAWSPWQFVVPEARHVEARSASLGVRTAVDHAVRALSSLERRHMVELSGGLDSSIVSMCLADSAGEAVFCTMVMPVTGTDESAYAKTVTDALGQPLLAIEVRPESARIQFPVQPSSVRPSTGILQDASNQLWDPLGTQHRIDSFFSGGGGDSIFCYLKTASPAADAFLERGVSAGLVAVHELSLLHQCTFWKAGRLAFRKLRQPGASGWKHDRTLLNPDCLVDQSEPHPWMQPPGRALPGDREKIHDLIGTQLFREATPRASGKPTYFPLLSQPVMEACLRVPSWMWISKGRDRAIARQAFADALPAAIAGRRSKGSYTGYLAAVFSRNKQQMRTLLMEGALSTHGLLDRTALDLQFQRDQSPRDISFMRIFELCTAENWVRAQKP
jgi:asparagine synthase (glutamine-hydrolysing)